MSRTYTYEHPRPALSCDVVVVCFAESGLEILLVRRKHEPFAGRFALPGGFVDEDEDLETAARRELAEETDLRGLPMVQLAAFGTPGRDPRGHTVSIAFLAFARKDALQPRAGDDAASVFWHPLADPPQLAFDHGLILQHARERLGRKARLGELGPGLLAEPFCRSELTSLYRAALAIDGGSLFTVDELVARVPLRHAPETGERNAWRFTETA